MGRYFGTDGFRGEANVDLTAEKAFKVGRYLGWYYGTRSEDGRAQIAIGKDTRRSSYMLEDALSAGLTASGADVYLLHVTTTPSVSYVVRTENFDCGIMISASHNPFYDNGIKIMRANGQKIEPEIEEKIEDYIDGKIPEIPYAHREKIGRTIDFSAGRNRYIGYLMAIPTRSFKGLRVGLDCSNGSASSIANINSNCGSTHIEVMQNYVNDNGLDVGFAYDGDADRCLAVDDKGNVVTGDHIMYVCGKYLKEMGQLDDDMVVTTVMSNLGLYKALDAAGMKYQQTAVGDKYVAENMLTNGYAIGGEQSGHIIFSKYATTGDGILTSLMIMQTMIEKKQPLSVLASEMKVYPQILKNVRVADKAAAQANPKVQAAVQAAADALGNDGRILVRESGTEPKIRVMVEAKTYDICEEHVDRVIRVIEAEGLAL